MIATKELEPEIETDAGKGRYENAEEEGLGCQLCGVGSEEKDFMD